MSSKGKPFFMLFTLYQFSMIFGIFMTISIHFMEYIANDGWWVKLLMSSGSLFVTIFDMHCFVLRRPRVLLVPATQSS